MDRKPVSGRAVEMSIPQEPAQAAPKLASLLSQITPKTCVFALFHKASVAAQDTAGPSDLAAKAKAAGCACFWITHPLMLPRTAGGLADAYTETQLEAYNTKLATAIGASCTLIRTTGAQALVKIDPVALSKASGKVGDGKTISAYGVQGVAAAKNWAEKVADRILKGLDGKTVHKPPATAAPATVAVTASTTGTVARSNPW